MTKGKSLVLDVSGWLRLYDDGSVDRTWTGPPEVKFVAESVPPHDEFIDGVAVRDLVIDQNSGLRVRIYLPEVKCGAEVKKLPVVVHFHGGGFCISEADWFMYYHTYTNLAKSAEAICVSVYLRRAPEHRLPAQIEDGFSALKWLQSVALGNEIEPWIVEKADFNRVFLIGDSSGGNLVHSVAARAGETDLAPLKLAGGIPIHPGFVRAKRSKSEIENPQSPFLTLDMVDKFLNLALPVGSSKDHPITCPMGSAAPPLENLNLPPFLLCIAEKDLVIDTEMEYYEAMKAANKEVEILMSKGMGHSFYLNKIALKLDPETAAESDRLFAGIARFIKQH
ncbi:putative carboxylesterase 15 [Cucumis melo var. makuwa]|uniref:Carboxylesterase 15 n=1 Tax=Cucumis melo var. makuwa TaxID=1194695 RepID=A0A5A7V9G7_CUCMM|nr:putative carboxylesterase 15 [Cucumis melo var. makuwa]